MSDPIFPAFGGSSFKPDTGKGSSYKPPAGCDKPTQEEALKQQVIADSRAFLKKHRSMWSKPFGREDTSGIE